MSDHVDFPPELREERCDCCGLTVFYRRASFWHGDDRICRPCFFVWYEEGLQDRATLRARRLAVYGTAPDV